MLRSEAPPDRFPERGRRHLHNDEPTLLDALDRETLIQEVGEAVATCNPPQVFGVHGDWGSARRASCTRSSGTSPAIARSNPTRP